MIERLHEAIKAVCPIVGVSVPTIGTSVGVSIQFDPSATAPQQANAQSVVAGFDWSQNAHDTWLNEKQRTEAVQAIDTIKTFDLKLLRGLADVIVNQLNALGEIIGSASGVWDPPNIANGAGATSPSFTVAGAAFGDFVMVAAPYNLQAIIATGYVSAANTVLVRIHNGTGAAVNLGSGTWSVKVFRHPGGRTLAQAKTAIKNTINAGNVD